MYGLGVWSRHPFGIPGVVALRIGPTALRVGGGPSFGYGAFSDNQRKPKHGDPVAFLHELGLREHAAVTRPKARCNTRLQARPYLHNIKTTRLCHHRSAPKVGCYYKNKSCFGEPERLGELTHQG
jgi:hypothetical protein